MKEFNKEIYFFIDKIKNSDPFSLVRVGDGEMMIIDNEFIDLSKKFNGEHFFDPNDNSHQPYRQILINSFQYNAPNYYVGVPCPCCVGEKRSSDIKRKSNLGDSNLTWANIFVNSNYHIFKTDLLPLIKECVIISHKKAKYNKLPFKILKSFKVGGNSWINDFHIKNDLIDFILKNNINNTVFLFAAGVLSNMLIYELHKINPNNYYLDIGSTLDVDMGLGATRRYLKGANTLQKICIW